MKRGIGLGIALAALALAALIWRMSPGDTPIPATLQPADAMAPADAAPADASLPRERRISGRVINSGVPVAGATVHAGRQLFGDSDSSRATTAAPAGAIGAKVAISDSHGEFTIGGLDGTALMVVAEHDEQGRSPPLMLPAATGATTLELVLQPYARLEGRVTRDAAPLPSVWVSITSLEAPGVSYGTRTDADGSFDFERLAPGEYKVQAMTGAFGTGIALYGKRLALEPGQTSEVELVAEPGPSQLTVALQGVDALPFAMINVVEGDIAPTSWRELQFESTRAEGELATFQPALGGAPVTFTGLRPGAFTVCAVAFPEGFGPGSLGAGVAPETLDALPVSCTPVALSADELEYAVTVSLAATTGSAEAQELPHDGGDGS